MQRQKQYDPAWCKGLLYIVQKKEREEAAARPSAGGAFVPPSRRAGSFAPPAARGRDEVCPASFTSLQSSSVLQV